MNKTIAIDGITYNLTPVEPPKPEYPDAAKWAEGDYREKYFFDDTFGISTRTYMPGKLSCAEEKRLFGGARAFTTKQAAQEQADRESLARRIQRWRDTHDPVELDWEDLGQSKFYYHFEHAIKGLSTLATLTMQIPGVTYFSSDALAEQCIAECGDEIKRVFYGIEEE